MFVDGSVEEVAEDGGEVWCDVFDDRWFDFVNVACFVGVDFVHDLGDLGGGDVSELKRGGLVAFSLRHDVLFFVVRDGPAGLVADGDVAVVECVRDVGWVCVLFPFVNEDGGGGSAVCLAWDD